MGWRKVAGLIARGIAFLSGSYGSQNQQHLGNQFHEHSCREFPAGEYVQFQIPADFEEKTEWVYARMMYPPMQGVHGRYYGGAWAEGGRSAYWTMDYPRSD